MLTLRRYKRAEDFDTLYREFGQFENSDLLYSQLSLGNEEAFSSWLEKNTSTVWHDFFIAETNGGLPIGFVYSYEFRRLGGVCKVCCYTYERYRGIGLGPLAGVVFLDRLFQRYPLRKVYAEIFGHNGSSLEIARSVGMEQEACFKEAYWQRGRYVDQYVFSLSRDGFYDCPSIQRLLKGRLR